MNIPDKLKQRDYKANLLVKILCLISVWAKESPVISFLNVTNAANLAIITQIVKTMGVIYYLFNAIRANNKCRIAAQLRAKILFHCH